MDLNPVDCRTLALIIPHPFPDPVKNLTRQVKFLKLSFVKPRFRGSKKQKRRSPPQLDMCVNPALIRSVKSIQAFDVNLFGTKTWEDQQP